MEPEKFQNKYRVRSTRLQNYDYSQNGHYFVTICTQNREHYFGEINDINEIGRIAKKYWLEIPNHFPFVRLDEFIIMPNHIHGIVIINKPLITPINVNVETQNFSSLQLQSASQQQNKFAPQSQNLASIIRGFKIGVKKYATIHNIDFAWQPRFYDNIIRDIKSLDRIRQYILDNLSNWETDENNKNRL